MSFFNDLTKSGLEIVASAAGVEIEIRRGNSTSVRPDIKGVPASGRRQFAATEVTRTADQQDWLIMAADYDFGDGPVRPRKDDQIVNKETGEVFEALPENGEDSYSGALSVQHRVHTKRIRG